VSFNYKEFLIAGKEKEVEFAKLLQNRLGGEVKLASEHDDIHGHVDIY